MGQRLETCEQSHLLYMPTLVAACMDLDLQILAAGNNSHENRNLGELRLSYLVKGQS